MYTKKSKQLQKRWRYFKMDKNQKINCTVGSCKFNNCKNNVCELESIIVTPKENVQTANPDESECSSYECGE